MVVVSALNVWDDVLETKKEASLVDAICKPISVVPVPLARIFIFVPVTLGLTHISMNKLLSAKFDDAIDDPVPKFTPEFAVPGT